MNFEYTEPLPLLRHPMKEYISGFYACSHTDCSEKNWIVEKGNYSVHPHSGDAYGSYTLSCQICKQEKNSSFADN